MHQWRNAEKVGEVSYFYGKRILPIRQFEVEENKIFVQKCVLRKPRWTFLQNLSIPRGRLYHHATNSLDTAQLSTEQLGGSNLIAESWPGLSIHEGLEAAVGDDPEDVALAGCEHLLDPLSYFLCGWYPRWSVDTRTNAGSIFHTLTEYWEGLLVRSGILDGCNISIHADVIWYWVEINQSISSRHLVLFRSRLLRGLSPGSTNQAYPSNVWKLTWAVSWTPQFVIGRQKGPKEIIYQT